MHFIGIAGMPRRIPDYADGYLNWNLIMTLGTFLTIISVTVMFKVSLADGYNIHYCLDRNYVIRAYD